jgi:hypothetical protein
MAQQYSVSIKGSQQGQFHGPPSKRGGHQSIPLFGFDFPVTAPRDASLAGNASGKRRWPIRIAVESGALGQQLFQAFSNHELLEEVIIRPRQPEPVAHTISLTNAAIPGYAMNGAQGPGRQLNSRPGPPSAGPRQPEPVAHTIHLTNATISRYASYGGSQPLVGNRGKQPVSFELDYSDIKMLPFRP